MFESPIYLWGLFAASIPWLLPVLNRRTPQRIDWAATRLLEAAIKKTRFRQATYDFLLRACRSAIFVGVVLAFAKGLWDIPAAAISHEKPLRVLLIGDGEPAFYLRHALEAAGFTTTVVASTESNPTVWRNVQVVICADVPSPPDGLKDYRGGAVLFFGQKTIAVAWNARFFDAPAISAPTQPEPNARLEASAPEHRIVEPFRDEPSAGLLTLPVWRYVPLNVKGSTTILSLDGDPIIAAENFRNGRRVLFATAPESRCSAMPVWPSFVPLVEESVRWAAGSDKHGGKFYLTPWAIAVAALLLIVELRLSGRWDARGG